MAQRIAAADQNEKQESIPDVEYLRPQPVRRAGRCDGESAGEGRRVLLAPVGKLVDQGGVAVVQVAKGDKVTTAMFERDALGEQIVESIGPLEKCKRAEDGAAERDDGTTFGWSVIKAGRFDLGHHRDRSHSWGNSLSNAVLIRYATT